MAKQTAKTSMTIKEVIGDESGGIVINIRARRGNSHYKLVYQIASSKVPEVDLEMLKLKVIKDIDEREAEAAKKNAVLDRIGLQINHKIPLD